ncbi:hypothetical protein [Luteimonas soli]
MNMKIIFSGLQSDRWRMAVSEEHERGRAVAWLEAKELLALSNPEEVPSDACVVWLFCSPIDAAMAVGVDSSASVEAALVSWLEQNRSALNLKRQLGPRLSFANGSVVTVGALCHMLEHGVRQETEAEPERGNDADLRAVLLQLLGQCDARYAEVYDALNAASRFGGSVVWNAIDSIPGWNQLIDVIDAVRLAGRGMRLTDKEEAEVLLSQLHLAQEELQQYALHLKDVEREGAARVDELEAMARAVATQRGQLESIGREKRLLLAQLQKVQTELENNFSCLREVEREKAESARSLGEERQQASILRLQLEEAAGELQHLASREPDLSLVATRKLFSVIGLRFLRKLVPGPIMRHRAGITARRELDRTLVQIRNSGWFDANWYLASYRDVKEAGVDPVEHYHVHGWREGRNPGPGFDSAYYLDANPDVQRIGEDPLLHFIRHGANEGRKPAPSSE